MRKTMTLRTSPEVCSESITITVENGVIESVVFQGGCPGNLAGISKLAAGMPVVEVIRRLKGNCCGSKNTSCPDQLAQILEKHFL